MYEGSWSRFIKVSAWRYYMMTYGTTVSFLSVVVYSVFFVLSLLLLVVYLGLGVSLHFSLLHHFFYFYFSPLTMTNWKVENKNKTDGWTHKGLHIYACMIWSVFILQGLDLIEDG